MNYALRCAWWWCLGFAVLTLGNLSAASPAAWEAYRQSHLLEARDLFLADLEADPQDGDALMGLFFLLGDVGGVPTNLEIAERLASLPTVPYPFFAAFHQQLLDPYVEKAARKRLDKVYAALLARPDLPEDLRANLLYGRQGYDQLKGQNALATAALASLHTLDDWSLAGAFRNPLGAGFDQRFGPLEHPQGGASFRNQNNVAVAWYPLRHHLPGTLVDLSDYSETEGAINYAQTFVTLPRAGEYALRLTLGGAAKVWVDDALVYAEEEERHTDLDHVIVRAQLAGGAHRILVQLGSAERSLQWFLARLTDAGGQWVNAVQSSATPLAYTSDTGLAFRQNFDETFLAGQAAATKRGAGFADRLTYAAQLHSQGHYLDLREWINVLQREGEFAPYVMSLTSALYTAEGDDTGSAEYLGRFKAKYPQHLRVLLEDYQRALEEKEFTKAQNLLSRIQAIAGSETEAMRLVQIGFDFSREEMAAGITAIGKARTAYPGSTTMLNMDVMVARNLNNDPDRARQLIVAYLKDYSLDAQLEALAANYNDEGKSDKAIGLYRELLERHPESRRYRWNVKGILMQQEKYEAALAEVDALLEQSPYSAGYHEERGDLLRRLNRMPATIAAYQRSLQLYPNDFALRTKLRGLRDERSLFSYLDSTNVAQVIELSGTRYDDTDHPFAQLSDETRFVVYEDGVSEYRVELLFKVLNEGGIEMLKEYGLDGVDIREARVIKPDGTKVDAERGGGGLVFAKLNVGDYLHIDYSGRDYNSGRYLGHFWGQSTLNSWYPTGARRYQLLVPKGRAFSHEVSGLRLSPKQETRGEFDVYTWATDDLPVLREEPLGPVGEDAQAVLRFTSVPDWQYIADWYSELSTSRVKPDYAVRAKVAELFPEGGASLSERARVERIYNFIVQKIEYSSLPFRQSAYVPQRAGKTLATQLGDCKDVSSLFVAMAGEVGVGADLVLVNTRDNGQTSMALPSTLFNHCIVRLRSTGEYLELTDKHLAPGSSSNDIYNSVALPIVGASRGAQLTQVTPGVHPNGKLVRASGHFEENELVLHRDLDFVGSLASDMRHRYRDANRDNQRDLLRDHVDARMDRPYTLHDFSFAGLGTPTDTVRIAYDVTVERALTKMQSFRILQLPWATAFGSIDFASVAERATDLCLWRYTGTDLETETIEIALPKGYRLLELPEAVNLEADGLRYALAFEEIAGVLRATRRWQMSRDEFTAEEYPAVRKLLQQVQEADQQMIGLQTANAK